MQVVDLGARSLVDWEYHSFSLAPLHAVRLSNPVFGPESRYWIMARNGSDGARGSQTATVRTVQAIASRKQYGGLQ